MSRTIADPALDFPAAGMRLNPAELKIDLLCRGLRVGDGCRIGEKGRPTGDRNGDRNGGLELILPGEIRELWVNVPVREKFARTSPYQLGQTAGKYSLHDSRSGESYDVRLAPRPEWIGRRTSDGKPMSAVGRMQGTFLAIDFDTSAIEPSSTAAEAGRGAASLADFSLENVVETAQAAQDESGVAYAFLRGNAEGSLARVFPFVKALKRDVGILISVQFPPEADLSVYERARDLGIDHLSFRFESFSHGRTGQPNYPCISPEYHKRALKALEHCTRIMGRGRVSGELTAGTEPPEETMRGIDTFVRVGAIPLIYVFRPLLGTDTENLAPPDFADMLKVFRHVFQACRSHNVPFSLAPNIRLSVLPHPEDTLYLAPDILSGEAYRRWILTLQQMMRPYFLQRMRKQVR